MMNCMTTFLTIFSVLLHAGVGCCAHHEHASIMLNADVPADSKAEGSENLRHCGCRHHAHCDAEAAIVEDATPPTDHDSCPCGAQHGTCSEHCSWLTASRVELPTDAGSELSTAIMDDVSFSAVASRRFAAGLSGHPLLLSDSSDSLRAQTQVWRL